MKRSHKSCVYKLTHHLVLVTKYRNKCLTNELLIWLESEFKRLLEANDCELMEFNGESDHVHVLISVHPSVAPANLINSLKTVKQKRNEHNKKLDLKRKLIIIILKQVFMSVLKGYQVGILGCLSVKKALSDMLG